MATHIMRRPTDVALYIAAALAAAYVLNQWMRWWDDDKTDPDDTPPPTLPPLRTHSLPPTLPSARPEEASQSDTDAESFDDILSPTPTHDVLSRRSSVRAHDQFAASHISFSELGSLVAPQND